MKIVGFGIEHKVGKDTAVKFALNYMRIEYPQIKCQRFSVGDKIRELAFQLYGWAGMEDCVHYSNHPEKKDEILPTIGKSNRQVCIELATALRKIHPRTFVELGLQEASGDVLFWPDIYTKSDLDCVRQFKGKYIKISRPLHEWTTVTEIQDEIPDELWLNHGSLKDFNKIVKDSIDRWVNDEKFI